MGVVQLAWSAFGGCLTLKHAVNAELLWGNCILAMEKLTNNPVKRLVIDLKLLKIIIRFEECN